MRCHTPNKLSQNVARVSLWRRHFQRLQWFGISLLALFVLGWTPRVMAAVPLPTASLPSIRLADVTSTIAAATTVNVANDEGRQGSVLSYFEQLSQMRQDAFDATNQGDFAMAETVWTKLIEQLPENPALWSNRGNSRVSQGKYAAALEDFQKATELAPEAPDPYLNRGAAYEGLGDFAAAIVEYNHVLELDSKDAAAYNNRGNAEAALGKWEAALLDYRKAALLEREFVIARANVAMAEFELGHVDDALRDLKNVVRKYPTFADARAALTATLWSQGKAGEAESNWVSVIELDSHYKKLDWIQKNRRWAPAMLKALESFLKLS